MLAHRVSFVNDIEIEGLVLDLERPLEPLVIEIAFDGHFFRIERVAEGIDYRYFKFVGEQAFSQLRETVGGVRTVPGHFRYVVPSFLYHSRNVEVRIVEQSTGAVLFEERRNFIENYIATVEREFENVVIGLLQPEVIVGGRLEFAGVFSAIADELDLDLASTSGAGVGHRVARVGKGVEREVLQDVGRLSHALLQIDRLKSVRISGLMPLDGGPATVLRPVAPPGSPLVIPASAGLPLPEDWYEEFGRWRIPGDAEMRRVMGHSSPLRYYLGGYASYRMIEAALVEFAGRGIDEFTTMLDWGCGCGRLTQQLVRRTPASKVTGIDIDDDNIAWCQANLDGAAFQRVDLLPPTGLAAESYDLVVGISVVTHLDEAATDAWLREIDRLLRPHGVVLLTVRALHHLAVEGILPEWFRDLDSGGMHSEIGDALNDVLPPDQAMYYRETAQSHRYIIDKWDRYFDVIGIKIGAHFNYQDLVVLRKSQPRPAPRITY